MLAAKPVLSSRPEKLDPPGPPAQPDQQKYPENRHNRYNRYRSQVRRAPGSGLAPPGSRLTTEQRWLWLSKYRRKSLYCKGLRRLTSPKSGRAGGSDCMGKSVFADISTSAGCAGAIGDSGHSYITNRRACINRAQESGVIVRLFCVTLIVTIVHCVTLLCRI